VTPDTPTRIDWDLLKQRLAHAEEALQRGTTTTPEARLAAHEARTRAIMAQPAHRGEGVEAVEFVLGGARYAVPSAAVVEVRALHALTALPCTPRFVSGIMSVQGRIIAVIDLKIFLDLPESGLTDLNKVIILRHADMEFGILADEIVGGRWIAQSPAMPSGQPVMLDVQRIVADPRFVIDAEVTG
jgi:purine-binding chemotaxis protein CheW